MTLRSDFDRSVRVLECPKCHAPVEVPLAGGAVSCPGCGAQSDYEPLDQDAEMIGLTAQPPADDHARVQALRAQDGHGLSLPLGLAGFASASPQLVPKMRAWFDSTLDQVRQGADAVAQKKLFFLAFLIGKALYPGGDDRTLRCVLESAVEATPLKRHAQMLRGTLSGAAVRAGDLVGAQDWLNACDPFSDDLFMDTARRIAASDLATAQQDWAAVLRELGEQTGAVPIADAYDEHAYLLQANALEQSGRLDEAVSLLVDVLADPSTRKVMADLRDHHSAHLHLCPESYPRAVARIPQVGRSSLGRLVIRLLGFVPLLIIPVMVFASGTFLHACAPRPYAMALARTNACPRATRALGNDIHGTLGLGCGNMETSGSSGSLSWTVPVSGSTHRGSLYISGDETRGTWSLDSLELHADGETIDVLKCTVETP